MAACTSAPSNPNARSKVELPEKYQHAELVGGNNQTPQEFARPMWWHAYGSGELNRLIERALIDNPDLRIARSQVVQAQIRAAQVSSGRLPTITAPVRATLGSGSGGESLQNSQVGLQASYRVDLWGEQSAMEVSSEQLLLRATYDRDNTQRILIGSVVATYFAYLTVSDSIAIAIENEAASQALLRTINGRLNAGDATLDEVERQRMASLAQQALLPGLISQRHDLHSALSRLLGVLPMNLELAGGTIDQLALPTISLGIPSNLLLNRPDVKAVEARMRSADANIDVARSKLLPSMDLALQGGYNGLGLAQLLQPQNIFWNGVASLAATIFDGGRRKADKALAQAAYEEMVVTYGQTVFQAVRDVEGALNALNAARKKHEIQLTSYRSALNAFKIGSDAYALGALDSASMLEYKKVYLRGLEETLKAKADSLRAYAALSLALGDGA